MSMFTVTAYVVLVSIPFNLNSDCYTVKKRLHLHNLIVYFYGTCLLYVDLFMTVTHTEVVLLYYLCLTEIECE